MNGIPEAMSKGAEALVCKWMCSLKPTDKEASGMKQEPKQNKPCELPIVALKDASELYQIVTGTSLGARYTVVGLSGVIKAAARYKDAKLSFRVEASNHTPIPIYVETCLKNEGLTHNSQGHWSQHYSIGTELMAIKTVGALLASLGVDWYTPIPTATKAFSKGK